MASLKATSHLKRYRSVRPYRVTLEDGTQTTLFNMHLGGLTKCSSYRGLVIMGEHFDRESLEKIPEKAKKRFKEDKLKQFQDFSNDLSNNNDVATLVVLLSNDYKTFLSNEGKMIPLHRNAKRRFDKLTNKQKITYSVDTHKPLLITSKNHLDKEFQKYENILKPILAKSNLEFFYHSSVLERINPKIVSLPLYFAVFNSVLKLKLNSWTKNETFVNRNGKPIKCIFVCVRDQFFESKDPSSLFIESIDDGELVHRKDWAMDVLVARWKKALLPHITQN